MKPEYSEELLWLALDPERAEERAAGLAQGDVELTAALAWAASTRATAAELFAREPLRESAFVDRVLGATTRVDEDPAVVSTPPTWPVFVRDRMRSSALLRVLAASLLVHLVAVPAVAWMALQRQRDPGFRLGFELADPGLAEPANERAVPVPPAEPPPLDPEADSAVVGALDPVRIENALRRARHRFAELGQTAGEPEAGGPDGPTTLAGWIAARAVYLEGGGFDPRFEGPDVEGLKPGVLAAAAELHLDLWVLKGERSPVLGILLNRLALTERDARTASGRLAAAALERARAYGLWVAPRAFDPETVPAPLGRVWLDDLEALGGDAVRARVARWRRSAR